MNNFIYGSEIERCDYWRNRIVIVIVLYIYKENRKENRLIKYKFCRLYLNFIKNCKIEYVI